MNEILEIYEVGPRDGLQNEGVLVSTPDKLRLVAGLVNAGISTIETASFVHPKFVPQMADAEAVMSHTLATYPHIKSVGLVLNERGYDRALATGCRHMAYGVSVSDTFGQRNSGMSSRQALEVGRHLLQRAQTDNIWMRVYIMTAWVCPYEGATNLHRSLAIAEQLWQMGASELSIADTIGYAHPLEVGWLMEELGKRIGMSHLAVHLHDTQAMGLANAAAAIKAGVRIIDTSVGGLGGCPFAPGAAGNLATEDLLFMVYKMGMGTGVDYRKLWQAVYTAEEMVKRQIGGRIREWWEANSTIEPEVHF